MADEHPSSVSGAFGLTFAEQVAFFRRKLGRLVPTERWDDMLREAHDDGFMVAGAAKADLLTDLAAAVDKAIAEGRGIEEFRKDFRAIVKRHGWTGWTGEGSVRGEAWRVATILRTNSYTSYAAGRYAQLMAGNFPYWVYFHGGSEEPRWQHIHEFDGLVLPPDHPFWAKFYPPSDWGCSCYVVGARDLDMARRMGGDPDKRLQEGWDAIDPATGEPEGIGRGWGYAPGASVADKVAALAAKIRHWDYQVAKAFMGELPADRADALTDAYRALPSTADDARRYAQRVLAGGGVEGALPPVRTLGRLHSAQAQAVSDATGIDASGFDFTLAEDEIRHIMRRHGDDAAEALLGQRAVTAEDYARLPELLRIAQPVAAETSRTGRPVFTFTARIGGQRYEAVFEVRSGRKTLTLLSYRIWR